MKLSITAFAFLTTVSCFAQPDLKVSVNNIAEINDMENLVRELSYTRNVETKIEEIEGSPYLEEQFIEGIVELSTGATYAGIPLRYNVYNDEIEFRNRKGEVYNINNSASIREVIIGESKFVYTDCKIKKENKYLFAEVIREGNVSLLKHHRLRLVASKPAQTHRKAQAPRLIKGPSEYLIRKVDGSTEHFRNEKELVNLLADKSDKIWELINGKKLSVHKEEDIIAIIDYYNGIY